MLQGEQHDRTATFLNWIMDVQFRPASPEYQTEAIKLLTCGVADVERCIERSLKRDGKLKETRRAAGNARQRWRASGVIRKAEPSLGLPPITDRFAGTTSLGVTLAPETRAYEYLFKLIKSKLGKCDSLVTTHGQLARELRSNRSNSGHVCRKTIQRGLQRLAEYDYLEVSIEKDRRTGFDIGIRVTLLPRSYPPGEREVRAQRATPWIKRDLPDFRWRQQRRLDLRDRCSEIDLGGHQCPTPYPAKRNTPCSAGAKEVVDACESCGYVDNSVLEVTPSDDLDQVVSLLEEGWQRDLAERSTK